MTGSDSQNNSESQNKAGNTDQSGNTGQSGDLYQPPKGAEETDRLDADPDGTSASHYGTNDPAQFEQGDQQE